MKGYKGFNKDMTCRGFQYSIGQTYEEPRAIICHSGFHFCETLKDCFDYYDRDSSLFCEVEVEGDIDREGNKCCCTKITILRTLSLIEINRLFYGYGYGDGNGNGDGNGYGDGYGYGYGYGYGDGYGDGYGNGNGNGYGNGYGDGYGYGYGLNIQKIINYMEEIA